MTQPQAEGDTSVNFKRLEQPLLVETFVYPLSNHVPPKVTMAGYGLPVRYAHKMLAHEASASHAHKVRLGLPSVRPVLGCPDGMCVPGAPRQLLLTPPPVQVPGTKQGRG